MRRVPFCPATCVAIVLLAFLATGCKEDTKPRLTRINVSPACGVVPVEVLATAYASGGDESGDPLGGGNNLEMSWAFGDNGVGSTAIAYHTYRVPGQYNVVVTATDPNGETTSATVPVTVLADSLMLALSTNFPGGTATTADVVEFEAAVTSCDVDFPAIAGDSVKLTFLWEMNDPLQQKFTGASPAFRFTRAGEYDIDLAVTYPAWAVTRRGTIHLTVTSAP